MSYALRPMQASDLDDAAAVMYEAYRTRGGRYVPTAAGARHILAGFLAVDGAFNRVAVDGDGAVIGYSCALRPRGHAAGCGPTAVRPDHWNTGVYALLVMNTISTAREHRIGVLRHQVDFTRANFGMAFGRMRFDHTGATFVKLSRSPRGRVPAPVGHDVRRILPADLPRVVAFDRARVVDADRTPDYMFMLEHMAGCGWVLERDRDLRGYAFSVPGMIVGPLAGMDPAAAIDALRIATACDQERGVRSVVHLDLQDRPLVEEAIRLGYTYEEMVLLMERSFDGGPLTAPPRAVYCLGLFGVP